MSASAWLNAHFPRDIPGKPSIYYKSLADGEEWLHGADAPLMAASVIKLPIMISAFWQFERGRLDFAEEHVLREAEKMPSCGALNRMHAGLRVTLRDLVELMIVLSDNTATNILIERMGIDEINEDMRALGLRTSALRRKLFNAAGHAAGIENTVSAREMGMLLERLYRGELVSPQASAQMLDILKNQKLNGKLPFYLRPQGIPVAHKTGEDSGITHDVGIIYSRRPFVLCMLFNETDTPSYERLMQDAARALAEINA